MQIAICSFGRIDNFFFSRVHATLELACPADAYIVDAYLVDEFKQMKIAICSFGRLPKFLFVATAECRNFNN